MTDTGSVTAVEVTREWAGMSKQARRALLLVVLAVALFFVISQPEGAADTVRSVIALIGLALASIATFFRSLF